MSRVWKAGVPQSSIAHATLAQGLDPNWLRYIFPFFPPSQPVSGGWRPVTPGMGSGFAPQNDTHQSHRVKLDAAGEWDCRVRSSAAPYFSSEQHTKALSWRNEVA